MKSVLIIAEKEFSSIMKSPIVVVICAILLIMALISAAGCSVELPRIHFLDHTGAFYLGVQNFFWIISLFFAFLTFLFAFLTMCVGITSIADERSNGSLRVLLSKPLYRRHVIVGKFLGISAFLLICIVLMITLFVSLTLVAYGAPASISDLALRMGAFAMLLFLYCSFALCLIFLFGILLGKAEAIIVSIFFVLSEWLMKMPIIPTSLENVLIIIPSNLYVKAVAASGDNNLFTPSLAFTSWFNSALPTIVLMTAEIVALVLVVCILFNREET